MQPHNADAGSGCPPLRPRSAWLPVLAVSGSQPEVTGSLFHNETKKRLLASFYFVVEMTGVEPVSKNISTRISPSAFSD